MMFSVFLICMGFVFVKGNTDNTTDFALRLINPLANKSKEGRLEIYYNGSWGTVCDDFFTDVSARVACASLGFGDMGAVTVNRYGPGTDSIWMDDVKCNGTENGIEQCSHHPWGTHDCTHREDVSINCGNATKAMRLNNSLGVNLKEGRLEIYYNGSWGTVCDDKFTTASARVACASLGFGYMGVVIGNRYGAGTGRIWLDDVNCTGTESFLERCTHNWWGVHNCHHDEDVSISCGNTRDFAIRLYNFFGNNSKEGRLEIYYSGKWGTVCDDFFTDVNAGVACASLGFGYIGAVIGNHYGPGTNQIWLDDVICVGTESGIDRCTHRGWGMHNCGHGEDVSISCGNTRVFAVRLSNSIGSNSKEGRLEIYYSGKWGTVCDDYFTNVNARVACVSLGFGDMGVVIGNRYGAGTGDIWLDDVNCTGTETGIQQCTHRPWGQHNCQHSEDVSVGCDCGDRNFTGRSGKISSPNFPLGYANGLDCNNYITATSVETIIITFLTFNTEPSSDWVTVTCDSGSTYTTPSYSGFELPPVLIIPACHSVKVYFHSDSSTTYTGFSLTYSMSTVCGERYYSGLSGKVSSPNYPMRYTNNLECYNYITVSHGQTVIVTFLNFNTESGFDWVQISCVSGNTITSPLYSGSQIPSVLTISSCRIVNVHFHTNNNVTDTGFSLTYNITVISGQNGSNTTAGSMVTVPTSRVPITTILTNANNATEPTTITVVPTTTGTATVQTTTSEAVVTTQVVTTPNSIVCFRKYFSGPTGTISSLNYPYPYTDNLDCYSYILVSNKHNIMIKFSEFATESTHDWVMFTCVSGNVFVSPHYSGSQIPASFTIFSCNLVNVSFHTDNSVTSIGFSFTYNSTSGCDNRYFSDPTGIILSPNFPRAYDHYLDCNSYISVLPGHNIAITFLAFSTEQNSDIVTITCSSGNAYASPLYSGHQIPAVSRISGCNLLKIHFRSDGSSTYTGFLLTYNITSGCGIENFSGSTGQISSPNFPMAYKSYLDCSSYISVTSGKTIIISFLTFNFESLHGWVEISCSSGKSFRPPRYSGSELPPVLTITNCSLVNVSFHTDGSVTNTGFILKYDIASDNGIRGFTTKPSNGFPRSDKTEAVIFNCTTTSEYLPWWTINDRSSRNYTITNSICEVITSSPYSSWFKTETLGPGSCNLIVSAPADSLYLLAGSLVCTDSTLSSARAILAPINIQLRLATDTKSMAAVADILRDEDIQIVCNSSFAGWNSNPSPVFTYFLYNGGPVVQMRILRTYWTSEGNVVSTIDTTDTSSAVLVKAPKDGVIPSYTCNIICDFFTNISDLTADSEIELSFSTEPVDFEVLYKTYQNLKLHRLILGALLGTAILTTVILVAIILSRKCRQPKRNTAVDAGHKCVVREHELRHREGEGNAYYAVDLGNAVEAAESEKDNPDDMYENVSGNAAEVAESENEEPDDIYENVSG